MQISVKILTLATLIIINVNHRNHWRSQDLANSLTAHPGIPEAISSNSSKSSVFRYQIEY